jgi:REP element-mobilizing transposase RayT
MSHSLSRVFVHSVWGTHLRHPWITEACDALLVDLFAARLATLRAELVSVGASEDHVHVVFRAPLARPIAGVVGALKSESSLAIARVINDPCFRWQVGYGAISVDPSSVPVVVDYVRRQRERHRSLELVAAWESCDRSDAAGRSPSASGNALSSSRPGPSER